MLVVAALVAALVTVPLAGGRLSALSELTLNRSWALVAALCLQVLVGYVAPGAPGASVAAAHVLSYVVAGYFIAANRHIPGWWLVGLGGLMNFAAIAANAGVMPASAAAAADAGLAEVPGRFANSAVVATPNLVWLGDVFAIPAGWPLANVFSAGDLCLAVGGALAVHGMCRSRLALTGAGDLSGLLAVRGFKGLCLAQACSKLGDATYALALATALVGRGSSGQALAGLVIARGAPGALASLLGGPLVDRIPRRGLMVTVEVVRALAVATLLAPVEPALGHLFAVAACLGGCEGIFRPSVHASVPDLVPCPRIVAANALVASTASLAIVGGGALGGLAPVPLGLRPVLVLAAAAFAASAATLAGLALRRPRPAPGRAPLRDLGVRLRHCRSSPLVRGVLVVTGLVVLAASLPVASPAVEALGPIRQPLGHLASWSFGMLLGASAAPAAARRWPRERLLPAGIVAMGMAAFGASQATAPSRLGLWLLAGGGSALAAVSYRSLLQERVAAGIRGRALATSEAVLTAAWLAGSAASGGLAAAVGLRPSFAISAALLLAAASMSTALITPRRARHAVLRSAARTVPSPG